VEETNGYLTEIEKEEQNKFQINGGEKKPIKIVLLEDQEDGERVLPKVTEKNLELLLGEKKELMLSQNTIMSMKIQEMIGQESESEEIG